MIEDRLGTVTQIDDIKAPRGRFELPRAKAPTSFPGSRLTGLGHLGLQKGGTYDVIKEFVYRCGKDVIWSLNVYCDNDRS